MTIKHYEYFDIKSFYFIRRRIVYRFGLVRVTLYYFKFFFKALEENIFSNKI